ncbi:hypothetical protein E8E14_010918 [Neopestalotiopsis sp. 37M]|nr:hypothetical protein E8E14_010918 [Neopestalotiopsis sp. 37M]
MTFAIGNSANQPTEVELSSSLSPNTIAAATATSSSHYPVSTEAWATYPAPQGASPIHYGDSLAVPRTGSAGYPSDTEWSSVRNSFSHSPASGFDIPMHDSGMGSHGYNTPYSYPYHGEFEAAPSPFLETASAGSTNHFRRSSKQMEPSASTRTRRRYPLSPPPPPPTTRSAASSKLRSASRASKNTHLNPPATEEERKNRASHNQVEKQYRNRLNAHFEALLNTLPQYMRGGEDEEDDDGDRKISKAEVLEMARRHILSLERELNSVEEERDELKESVERLRWSMARPDKDYGKGMDPTGPV